MELPKISFYNEISRMMFAFGDSNVHNPDTVTLVESIVLKQLRTIVNEALKYWDGHILKGEDLIFLLRHNKIKMQRFIRYLQNKILTNKFKNLTSNIIDLDSDELPKNKMIEFIEKIDETGEFTSLSDIDEVKIERQIRANMMANELDEKKYAEFHKARCTSFGRFRTSLERLRLWIDPKRSVSFNQDALDVLSYFAYQTVAEIVGYALLVREDAKAGTDPFKNLHGSYYTNTILSASNRFGANEPETSKVANQPPISVNEIKEVMRRVHSPQAGKLNFGGSPPVTHYLFAL
ncbi:transcription initiation protein Spt3 [Rhynchophorus ferrugineus]|uniref:Transcription initiation protein SPT3-like protein n=1 Tax=Rhynchophorus ferrugineus TaxID=354439 RepID=A0A834M4I1_RHYFE|nr:hypothetical protein GWI33_022344 [Rhynchophorus ferrugineus]KAF7264809.1 hypothetical protein GWI33_022339 [Rhynchophorus ferrugineus]